MTEQEQQIVMDKLAKATADHAGKKVYILPPHPHAGEVAEVVSFDLTALGPAMAVKTDWEEFYVFKKTEYKVL